MPIVYNPILHVQTAIAKHLLRVRSNDKSKPRGWSINGKHGSSLQPQDRLHTPAEIMVGNRKKRIKNCWAANYRQLAQGERLAVLAALLRMYAENV